MGHHERWSTLADVSCAPDEALLCGTEVVFEQFLPTAMQDWQFQESQCLGTYCQTTRQLPALPVN
eukprot:3975142-Amphidinium_carterae.1